MKKKHPILTKKIEELAVSGEFMVMARKNEFQNLQEITSYPVTELMKKPGMNYRMLSELGEVLSGYGLIDIMKDD